MSPFKTPRFPAKWILGMLAVSLSMFATTLADDYMYVNAAHLNVRAAGTFRSSIVATVDSGYKVTILETLANGWKKVLLENGEQGYVNGRYLTERVPYFAKAEWSMYTVVIPSAFVRGDGFVKKIAVLHKGDKLEVLDEKIFLGKWLRVKVVTAEKEGYKERVGYISKKLVTVVAGSAYMPAETPVTTPEASINNTLTPKASYTPSLEDLLNLNSAPVQGNVTTPANTTSSATTGSTTDSADLWSLLGDLLK